MLFVLEIVSEAQRVRQLQDKRLGNRGRASRRLTLETASVAGRG